MDNNASKKNLIKPLISFSDLRKKSWQLYQSKLWVVLGIELVYLLLAIVFSQLYVFIASLSSLGLIVYWVFILEFCFWFIIGNFIKTFIIYAVIDDGNKKSFKELYKLSKDKFLSVTWVSILQLAAIMGGLLVLFVPALILAVGLSIVSFVVILEDLKGREALIKSWNYVKSNWFQVFWLLLAAFFVYFLTSGLIFLILSAFIPKTILFSDLFLNVYFLISFLLFSPYLIIYSYYLYQDIRSKKSEECISSDKKLEKKQKIIFSCLSLIGLGLIIASIVSIFLEAKRFWPI